MQTVHSNHATCKSNTCVCAVWGKIIVWCMRDTNKYPPMRAQQAQIAHSDLDWYDIVMGYELMQDHFSMLFNYNRCAVPKLAAENTWQHF